MAEPPFPGGSIPAQLCSRRCLHSHPFPALSEQSGSTGNYCLEENKTKSPNYAGMTSRLIPAASSGNSAAAAAEIPPCPSRTQGTRTNIRVLSGHGGSQILSPPPVPAFHRNFKIKLLCPLFPASWSRSVAFPAFPRLGISLGCFFFLPTSPSVCFGLEFGIWSRSTDAWDWQTGMRPGHNAE